MQQQQQQQKIMNDYKKIFELFTLIKQKSNDFFTKFVTIFYFIYDKTLLFNKIHQKNALSLSKKYNVENNLSLTVTMRTVYDIHVLKLNLIRQLKHIKLNIIHVLRS